MLRGPVEPELYTWLVTGEESGGAYFAMLAVVPPQGKLIIHSGEKRKVLEWGELKDYRGSRAQRGAGLTRGWRQVDRLESASRSPAE